MATKVLFFGQDTHSNIPVLRQAGYAVDEHGLDEMDASIVAGPEAAGIAVSGAWEPFLPGPISIARDRTRAPFILFAGPGGHFTGSIFDLVVAAGRPSSQWLSEIDLLIRECAATRAEACRVISDSDALSERTQLVIEQARFEREMAKLARESSQAARDRSRAERERSRTQRERSHDLFGMTEVWSLGEVPSAVNNTEALPVCGPCEERDKLNWSIMIAVSKLSSLLFKGAKLRLDNETSDEIDALLVEEKGLAADLEALLNQWTAHRAEHGC